MPIDTSTDLDPYLRDFFDRMGPRITAALRSSAAASGIERRTGKLSKMFRHKIREDRNGIWGLSFGAKRYAFVLHNGIQAGTVVKDSKRNRSYTHNGLNPKGFIDHALDPLMPEIMDELSQIGGDALEASIRL